MPYVQNSDADRDEMLAAVGVKSIAELFTSIPEEVRLTSALNLDAGLSEDQLLRHMQDLSSGNQIATGATFLGGGVYDHSWPTAVDHIMSRSEFLTAYTPYQPECSQGTLQCIFEFQSMIAELCGCEIANASMYDGASAAAEAALMAISQTRRNKVVVSQAMHPEIRETIHTYLKHLDAEMVEAPIVDGVTDFSGLVDDQTAAVMVQQPNFFGNIEDVAAVAKIAKEFKALSVASLYPVATGILQSPGSQDIDIVVGDGQSLGVPMAFGGPSFGFFATRQKFVRKTPGRLVGISTDSEGRRAFTLTFQTREQHIRREKATSNICTNNALIALRGCVHMAALGPQGLEEVACVSRQRAIEMVELLDFAGVPRAFPKQHFFNEVCFQVDNDEMVSLFKQNLKHQGVHAVLAMSAWYDNMDGCFTLACTERTTPEDLIALSTIAKQTFSPEIA
ncbi:MAG: glycine dehydrogenase subunit 1 [Myxococcota bacterium]|jgi:glycine dehydrogenase subunit 1